MEDLKKTRNYSQNPDRFSLYNCKTVNAIFLYSFLHTFKALGLLPWGERMENINWGFFKEFVQT